jgi:hypothetical protein
MTLTRLTVRRKKGRTRYRLRIFRFAVTFEFPVPL